MDADWIKSPTGRRVLAHWGDARPAWLWSADGQTLLWRNAAARLFNARIKKHGLRLAPEAVPIKGQIARLIRLGLPGRSSLSRMQFLAGGRPLSATCSVTPLELPERQMALLVVAVDPVNPEVLTAVETGPVMQPMRECPSSIKCRVASQAPRSWSICTRSAASPSMLRSTTTSGSRASASVSASTASSPADATISPSMRFSCSTRR